MLSGLGVVDIKGLLNSYSFYTSEDIKKKAGDAGKIVRINKTDIIETTLFGPRIIKGNKTMEAEIPLEIKPSNDSAILKINNENYKVQINNWSPWIRVKYPLDFLREVNAIFKAYLLSTDPFNMYVTSLQIDPENPIIDITSPKDYGKELAKEIGLFYTMGMPEDTKALTENRIGKNVFLEQINHIENERTKMFWYEFNRFSKGVLAFGFDAGDRLQHIFWTNRVLSNNTSEVIISPEIEDYYIKKDMLIGEILEKMDSKTHLIIFSDHGFSSFEKAVDINSWLVVNGYMTLKEKPNEQEEGALFSLVDWNKTKAYSLGFASVYINQKGREGNGIVNPEEKNDLIEEIIKKLRDLKDPQTGQKAITNAYKGRDIYHGIFAGNSPDIVIGFKEGYRMSWQTAIGGLTPEIFNYNEQEWVGDHLMDRSHVPGVIFTDFKIEKENPSLMDIAPTILDLLRIKIPDEMDGKNLVVK